MERQHIFQKQPELKNRHVVSNGPKKLFLQETDWTCSIACIRTLLSGFLADVEEEKDFVEKYSLKPGPHYSRDIKRIGILDDYDTVYGCDAENVSFDMVLDLMKQGYYIMLECMYNYAHWLVLLGYYPLDNSTLEKSSLLVYDPYYNNVRLLNADEFIAMWIDGNYGNTMVEKDFIAIRKKQ